MNEMYKNHYGLVIVHNNCREFFWAITDISKTFSDLRKENVVSNNVVCPVCGEKLSLDNLKEISAKYVPSEYEVRTKFFGLKKTKVLKNNGHWVFNEKSIEKKPRKEKNTNLKKDIVEQNRLDKIQ